MLGANDGLVSNLSLVMGVAGASTADEPIVIAGLAGLLADEANRVAGQLFTNDREVVLDVLAREELGLDPDELGGSPWAAAVTYGASSLVGLAV